MDRADHNRRKGAPSRTAQFAGAGVHTPAPRLRVVAAAALLLALGTLIAFAPVLDNDFVNHDDPEYVYQNERVQAGLTREGVSWALKTGHSANWHPLTWISHMFDVEFYGENPRGHHLTNLLLHTLNGVLVFLVLLRLTGAVWSSFFVAAFFAVHPLRVESVAWIAERKDVLSFPFWMLSIWLYARYVEHRTVGAYLGLAAAFVLGLMAKPMLVTLPFVLLLLDYWPLGRMYPDHRPASHGESFRPLVIEKLPLFVLSAASSLVTFLVQRHSGAVGSLSKYTLDIRIGNAVRTYLAYIEKTFWPQDLSLPYLHRAWSLFSWEVLWSALVLTVVTAWVLRAAHSRRYLPVGWLWYLGTLVPVIGLVQVGPQAMADRYTYIPSIGLAMCLAWGGAELGARWRGSRLPLAALSVMTLVSLILVTRSQSGYWKDGVTLFQHTVQVEPDNYLAHTSLGAALFGKGELEAAERHFSEAVRLAPRYPSAYYRWGMTALELGKLEDAARNFSEFLRLEPGDAETHTSLGVVLARQGRLQEAIERYRSALRIEPQQASAHLNLGRALEKMGNEEEALDHYRKTVQIGAGAENAHYSIGLLLARRGEIEKATGHFEHAVRVRPDFVAALNNLGTALAAQGRFGEAERRYVEAILIDPENAIARANLERLREALGK